MWRGEEPSLTSSGNFILQVKVVAPVMDDSRQALRHSGKATLPEQVSLSLVLFNRCLFSGLFFTVSKSVIFFSRCSLQEIQKPAGYTKEINIPDQAFMGSIGFKC